LVPVLFEKKEEKEKKLSSSSLCGREKEKRKKGKGWSEPGRLSLRKSNCFGCPVLLYTKGRVEGGGIPQLLRLKEGSTAGPIMLTFSLQRGGGRGEKREGNVTLPITNTARKKGKRRGRGPSGRRERKRMNSFSLFKKERRLGFWSSPQSSITERREGREGRKTRRCVAPWGRGEREEGKGRLP